jgi:hypothetical protein
MRRYLKLMAHPYPMSTARMRRTRNFRGFAIQTHPAPVTDTNARRGKFRRGRLSENIGTTEKEEYP